MQKRLYPSVRPVTEHLWMCLMFDAWPDSPAVLTDFGIASQEHFGALQHVAHEEIVSIDKFDELLGNGPALTATVNVEGNPYAGVVFKTPWDDLQIRSASGDVIP